LWCWRRLEKIKKFVREMKKYCNESRRKEISYKD